jgi:bacterioferritin-associated ferredoxin
MAVSEQAIREIVANGVSTAAEVMERTGAGTRCGTCRATVTAMVEGSSSEEQPLSCGVRRLRVLRAASSAA